MLRKLVLAVYRGFFWTYERGSWQYDIMVIVIVVFVLFTPRDWFGDQPPSPQPATGVVLLLSDPTMKVYRLRANLIDVKADRTLAEGAQRVMRSHTGKSVKVVHVEPSLDAHGQVVSYAVWVRE
ncbi:MAG: hypothetical protein HY647_04310 [Acidobacteria bacterium]|nr:hypothetical protein [Acidobacteriota bacterium]